MKKILGIAFFIVSLSFPILGFTQKKELKNNYLEKMDQAYYQGDFIKFYQTMSEFVLANPLDEEALLCYKNLAYCADFMGTEEVLSLVDQLLKEMDQTQGLDFQEQQKNEILKKKYLKNSEKRAYFNEAKLILQEIKEQLLYLTDIDAAKEYSADFHPLRKWRLSKTYNKYGYADFDYVFSPEIYSFKKDEYENRLIYEENPRGIVNLKKYIYPRNGVIYASTTITNFKPVKVKISSKAEYKLFVNGKFVLENKYGRTFRKERIIEISETTECTLTLKLHSSGNNFKFRLTVLDLENNKMAVNSSNQNILSSCQVKEIESSLLQQIKKNQTLNLAKKNALLGDYFFILNSDESLKYYRQSLKEKDDLFVKENLALALQYFSTNDTARYLEYRQLIDELYLAYPDFITIKAAKIRELFSHKDYEKAYLAGLSLAKEKPEFFPHQMFMLKKLKEAGYLHEFNSLYKNVVKIYPNSFSLKIYSLVNSSSDYEKELKKLFAQQKNYQILSELINCNYKKGNYQQAINYIDKYDYRNLFVDEKIHFFIELKDYQAAENLIFSEIKKTNNPDYYFSFVDLAEKQGKNAEIYQREILKQNPGYYEIADQLFYEKKGKISSPFAEEFNLNQENYLEFIQKNSDYSVVNLFKGRSFQFYKNGFSRLYCEDVLFLRDKRAIRKYGEYKIPIQGNIVPISVQLKHQNGQVTETSKFRVVNGSTYITLSALKEGDILHLRYYVNNPISSPRSSILFSQGPVVLQNYYEPLLKGVVRLEYPKDLNLQVVSSLAEKEITELENKRKIVTLNWQNLPAQNEEYYDGPHVNLLPFYGFSTVKGDAEFVTWYRGFLENVTSLPADFDVEKLRGKTVEQTIKNIYAYVLNETVLTHTSLYSPNKAGNTLVTKQASVEDRTFLALALLQKLEIKAFPAYVRWKELNNIQNLSYVGRYHDVLLYLPEQNLWLDFASKYYPAGCVRDVLTGSNALIIMPKTYTKKRVKSKLTEKENLVMTINLAKKEPTFSLKLKTIGRANKVKVIFKKEKLQEQTINGFLNVLFVSSFLKDYKLSGLTEIEKPFILEAQGKCANFAVFTDNKMIFEPILNKSNIFNYIKSVERKHPLYILETTQEVEEYHYLLPKEYIDAEYHYLQKIESQFGIAKYSFIKEKGSAEFILKKNIYLPQNKIASADYAEFLQFILKIKDFEYKNVILEKSK